MPTLKGHLKITLHNVKTGEDRVVEEDNIVSNALRDILVYCNYADGIDISKLMPLYEKWYGGVLCYSQLHNVNSSGMIDPNDYYPKGDDISTVLAHAGDANPEDVADDLTRGYPGLVERIDVDTIKFSWTWSTQQATCPDDVYIQSVSLTHRDTGNAGLGRNSNAFKAYNPFEEIQGAQLLPVVSMVGGAADVSAQYDADHAIMFYLGGPGEFYYEHSRFPTNKISVYIRKYVYQKVGLFDTILPTKDYDHVFTVETNTVFYNQTSFYFDYENKQLWLFSNLTDIDAYSTTTVTYEVIDCINETVISHGVITSSDLAPTGIDKNTNSGWDYRATFPKFANIIKEGNYVYLPTSSGAYWGSGSRARSEFNITGYNKINLLDNTDSTHIAFNDTQVQLHWPVKAGGLIINSGRVVNGGIGYTCADLISIKEYDTDNYPCMVMHQPYNPCVLTSYTYSRDGSATTDRYILANKMLNTTMVNLSSPVHKGADEAMTIEYTIHQTS